MSRTTMVCSVNTRAVLGCFRPLRSTCPRELRLHTKLEGCWWVWQLGWLLLKTYRVWGCVLLEASRPVRSAMCVAVVVGRPSPLKLLLWKRSLVDLLRWIYYRGTYREETTETLPALKKKLKTKREASTAGGGQAGAKSLRERKTLIMYDHGSETSRGEMPLHGQRRVLFERWR